jgi:hypothetical protein
MRDQVKKVIDVIATMKSPKRDGAILATASFLTSKDCTLEVIEYAGSQLNGDALKAFVQMIKEKRKAL